MDNKFLPTWIIQTLGVLVIIFMALLILNQVHNLQGPSQVMRISAEGRVTAVPDVAVVTLGVTSEGATPIEVKNKNNQNINQIINFIKQQGIGQQDIQTTGFNSAPKYNYVNGQNILAGYQTDQTITIKLHDIDKSQAILEKVLDGVVNNGANQIQGINFSFTDTDKLKKLARKQAIKKATEKAIDLTTEAHLKLGKVINVIEAESDASNPMPYAAATNFMARSKSIKPNIEPGNQEVSETITLVFAVN